MKRLLMVLPLVLAVGISCAASPNYDELKSFRVLVPDFSKTSGGLSPAVSPNGDDLAYYSAERPSVNTGDVYLMVGCVTFLKQEGTTVDPRKLEYQPKSQLMADPQRSERTRDMDWSPDGNFLAFVGKGGDLYIAHVCDPVNKKPGAVRSVASANAQPGDMTASVRAPRWSPDGKLVAYIRTEAGQPAKVCVADVGSGRETVLAQDGTEAPWIWEQPWSPDSKRIVYAGGKGSMSIGLSIGSAPPSEKSYNKDSASFIAIISVDGKRRTEISKGTCLCPSWSPRGDRIAYMSATVSSVKLAEKRYIGGVTMTIWTSDIRGGAKKQLTGFNVVSKKDAVGFEAAFNKAAAEEFEKDYASKLTPAQLARLKSGKMGSKEMMEIARRVASKETGVDLKNWNWPVDRSGASSSANPKVMEAYSKAMGFLTRGFMQMMPLLAKQIGTMDLAPVWSPDAQHIAFVHGFPEESYVSKLMVLDVGTGKSRTLLEQAGIESVSWTRKGELLVTQSRRLMSREGSGMEVKAQPGYPEVWLLEPK